MIACKIKELLICIERTKNCASSNVKDLIYSKNYIEKNYMQPISIYDLSKFTGYSHSHFRHSSSLSLKRAFLQNSSAASINSDNDLEFNILLIVINFLLSINENTAPFSDAAYHKLFLFWCENTSKARVFRTKILILFGIRKNNHLLYIFLILT